MLSSPALRTSIVAAASGAAWGLCFGRVALPWLACVALVPLLLHVAEARSAASAAGFGFLQALVGWIVSVPWIVATVVHFGGLPQVVGIVLLLAMCSILASWTALFALLARRLLGAGTGNAEAGSVGAGFLAWCVVLPALWTVLEWARGHAPGFLGFPWNLAGYAWVDTPGALPLTAWIGTYGVSFLVVAVNGGVALARRRRRWEPLAWSWLTAALLLALAARWSLPERRPTWQERDVVVVQPNQDIEAKDNSTTWQGYERLRTLSRAECRGGGRLLVWPESAAWPFTWDASPHLRDDLLDLASRGCAVILNTPVPAPGGMSYYNSALLVTVDGAEQRYDKRRLVPWGEYVPLEDVFSFVGTLARQAGRFARGESMRLLEWEGERLGVSICFESIFPEHVAEQVRAGASLLVTISNDAWYGDSSAPYQLFRAARFRAAENRRAQLRAALTGISGLIGPRGEVLSKLALGDVGTLETRFAGREELTPFSRRPWLVPLVCVLLVGLALAGTITSVRAPRRRPALPSAPNLRRRPRRSAGVRCDP